MPIVFPEDKNPEVVISAGCYGHAVIGRANVGSLYRVRIREDPTVSDKMALAFFEPCWICAAGLGRKP